MEAEPLAVVGVVGKPFGLHGDVYVRPDPDLDDGFPPGGAYHVADARPDVPRTLTAAESRLHSGRRVVRFDGITDRASAERLRGAVLTVPRAEAALPEGLFWTADLVGREVTDPDGAVIGVVEGVLDGHAHDYLVLARPDGGEVLVPAVADLLEITGERIVVQVIPGLIEE